MRAWLVVLIVVALAARAHADDRGTIAGVIHDRATHEPVPGVIVTAGDQFASSDDAGRFELELPPGRWTLSVVADWIAPVEVKVALRAGQRLELDVPVDQQAGGGGEVVQIIANAPPDPGTTHVSAEQARQVPGASNDVLKVVQALPGVARPPPGSGDLVVWGAAPQDTRVFVDGVPVPALYHVGGWRATVASDLVDDVALLPGGFGVEHGGAIGGVVEVTTRAPPDDDGATASADVLDGGAHGHARLGPVRVLAGGRVSWLDRAVDLVETRDPTTGRAPSDVVPIPRWADGQLALSAPLGRGDELRALVVSAHDALDQVVASDDPSADKRQVVRDDWVRAAVTWIRSRPDADSRVTVWGGGDRASTDDQFGGVPADLRRDTALGGVRANYRTHVGRGLLVGLGVDAQASRDVLHRDGSLSLPPREGDVAIFGQPPGDDVNTDDWHATTVDAAPYATLDWITGPLTITPGLRVDGYLLQSSRLLPVIGATPPVGWQSIQVAPEPRLAIRLREGRATYSLDAGMYHQARDPADASAVFGTPTLGLERGFHAVLGAHVRVADPLDAEAVAYGRWLDDLVVRDPAATPPLAHVLDEDGAGRVAGVQLVVRLRAWHDVSGWVTYALSRSERQDVPGGGWRLFDHDQTHALAAVVGWERGPWSAGGRVRWVTGEPRTEVVGAYFDARLGRWDPILGAHNGIRLPDFAQLDVRGERRFTLGAAKLAIYAEVHNVTARANAEEIAYSADYGAHDYITGLPIVAVIGARGEL
jgi:hypothetical protein